MCFLNIFSFLSNGFLVLLKFAQTVVVYGYLCSSLTVLLCLRPINTQRDSIMRWGLVLGLGILVFMRQVNGDCHSEDFRVQTCINCEHEFY